jgi:hypothetical protein
MLSSKTVFVVGAGASFEVGLPVGNTLKETISTKLDLRVDDFGTKFVGSGDTTIYNALQTKYSPAALNTYLHSCWQIRDGIVLSPSIDDFINAHQHDSSIAFCGKLAIARSILEAERNSKLFYQLKNVNDTINFSSISATWYTAFFQLISKNVTKSNIDGIFENVTIISFNYDRCIEHFLVHSIATFYQISIEESRKLVEKLVIFHPYGSVGPYFEQRHKQVEFGFKGMPDINTVLSNLKTYTERIEDTVDLKAIRQSIIDAGVIVFLGNAFHTNNMKLLMDEEYSAEYIHKKIYATRLGISETDLSIVKKRLANLCGRKLPNTDDLKVFRFANTCSNLFEEYRMSMSQ